MANVSRGGIRRGAWAFHVDDQHPHHELLRRLYRRQRRAFCSAPVTYIEDSTPPRVRVTMGTGVKTRRTSAVFRFTECSASGRDTLRCKVAKSTKWSGGAPALAVQAQAPALAATSSAFGRPTRSATAPKAGQAHFTRRPFPPRVTPPAGLG